MTVDDGDIRSLLVSRADRADARALRTAVVEAAQTTPQLRPVGRVSPASRRVGAIRVAVGIAGVSVIVGAIAILVGPRPPERDTPGAAETGASPILTPGPVASASPSDVLVTAPPYVAGSCPVTPITVLAGGVAPKVVTGGIRWGWGPSLWEAEVGQKVVLERTSPDQLVSARQIIAERLPIASLHAPLSVRYPRGSGSPGFIFGVGLPEPGCWLLTAVGPTLRSSVVVEAAPAPANPPPAESQNVPAQQEPLVAPTECPVSPQAPGAAVRTWLDGDSHWQDPNPANWVAGIKRKLVISGAIGALAPYELIAAARVGTVGPADSQRSAFVTDAPAFTAPAPGSGSKAMELILPTGGCWAITYLDPARTSTIVVEIGG